MKDMVDDSTPLYNEDLIVSWARRVLVWIAEN